MKTGIIDADLLDVRKMWIKKAFIEEKTTTTWVCTECGEEKTTTTWVCTECGEEFRSESCVDRHIDMHRFAEEYFGVPLMSSKVGVESTATYVITRKEGRPMITRYIWDEDYEVILPVTYPLHGINFRRATAEEKSLFIERRNQTHQTEMARIEKAKTLDMTAWCE